MFEIKGHYRNANHLRQDQRYREDYFPEAVRGKGARILHADQLAAERKLHMDREIWKGATSGLFYFDVFEGKSFVLTRVED